MQKEIIDLIQTRISVEYLEVELSGNHCSVRLSVQNLKVCQR